MRVLIDVIQFVCSECQTHQALIATRVVGKHRVCGVAVVCWYAKYGRAELSHSCHAIEIKFPPCINMTCHLAHVALCLKFLIALVIIAIYLDSDLCSCSTGILWMGIAITYNLSNTFFLTRSSVSRLDHNYKYPSPHTTSLCT
eukprot:m.46922 g.46922  ORF g.46922 m.46922 type:complete len:143 (-) comp10947_c0_seq5:822-1250(-)